MVRKARELAGKLSDYRVQVDRAAINQSLSASRREARRALCLHHLRGATFAAC
jgi:hypothetical protein